MDKDILNARFDLLLEYLPDSLKDPLGSLDNEIKAAAQEIRLRAGRPLSVTVNGTQFFIKRRGTCMLPKNDCITVSSQDISDSFLNLCHNSVYSHNQELCKGYIMLKNGHRAGVCGTVSMHKDKIETVRDISSINIRIAKEVPSCADELIAHYKGGGVLICGGPGTGKTTLLRDFARQLASGVMGKCLKVAVIDSRGEIAAVSNGVPMTDLGSTTDIITGCPKGEGIEMALRTLYPEIIVFDELGDMNEVFAVEQSFHSGVAVIATAHAGELCDLYRRKQIKSLLNTGAIEQIVMCKNQNGFEYSVFDISELNSLKNQMVTV